jgi:hypothetical protein
VVSVLTTERTAASSPSRSDWRLSPDEGEDVLSVVVAPDEGGVLSTGVLVLGALGASTALDEGASDGAGLSEVVDVVSDIQVHRFLVVT